MRGRPISYSREELAWVECRREMPRAVLHREFCATFGRADVSVDALKQLCLRNGWKTGRDGRLRPGNVPPNKGKMMPFNANSARTQFKPGSTPQNIKPLWHERDGKDGYIEMKVPLANPYTGHATRYMHKHRYLWEQLHGPIPKGQCLKALDGNRRNTDPINWELIPRALLPRLNGGPHRKRLAYDEAEPELRPLILATARLDGKMRAIRRASK